MSPVPSSPFAPRPNTRRATSSPTAALCRLPAAAAIPLACQPPQSTVAHCRSECDGARESDGISSASSALGRRRCALLDQTASLPIVSAPAFSTDANITRLECSRYLTAVFCGCALLYQTARFPLFLDQHFQSTRVQYHPAVSASSVRRCALLDQPAPLPIVFAREYHPPAGQVSSRVPPVCSTRPNRTASHCFFP